MSPTGMEKTKLDWPVYSGNREEYDGFSQLLVFALMSVHKLGYIAVENYNPTEAFTFRGQEFPPVVVITGAKDG
ncbi:hypothetical protein ATCC90586_012153 [Pythium insidiosum]|nr:hypothetical protein ATCC90586_012153 [Pythium insidiosum]